MGGIVDSITSVFDGGGSSAPATPDYTGAANATAANNLAAARAATAANRVNQVTPFGSLNYTQAGTDTYGNPMWSATQTVDPSLQAAVDKSKGVISGYEFGQFKPTGLPSIGINPGESMTDSVMRRLQPQMAMEQKQFDAQMANQGIPVGTEAYNNAARIFQQGQNDKMTSAVIQGTNTGLTANQQQFGQQQSTYNTNLNAPFNYASNVKAFASPNYINPTQQATTAGADILGATQAGYNANMGAYNADQARTAGMTSGLMGLGGTLGAAYMLAPAMSDIRTKENIKTIGWLPNGLPVYEYEYKPKWKDEAGHGKFVGVMAQEVELVQPEAVITRPDGYKMVNYGVLNG